MILTEATRTVTSLAAARTTAFELLPCQGLKIYIRLRRVGKQPCEQVRNPILDFPNLLLLHGFDKLGNLFNHPRPHLL